MSLSKEQMQRMLDTVIGHINGCPEAAIRTAISDTVETYCRAVGGIPFWTPFKMPHGSMIVIPAPFGGRMHAVFEVQVMGLPLNRSFYKTVIQDGIARVVFFRTAWGMRRIDGPFGSVYASWIPSHNTDAMPEDWFEENFDAIKHGVVAALAGQMNNPWGNEAVALAENAEYSNLVSDAIRRRHGHGDEGRQLSCFDRSETWVPGGF